MSSPRRGYISIDSFFSASGVSLALRPLCFGFAELAPLGTKGFVLVFLGAAAGPQTPAPGLPPLDPKQEGIPVPLAGGVPVLGTGLRRGAARGWCVVVAPWLGPACRFRPLTGARRARPAPASQACSESASRQLRFRRPRRWRPSTLGILRGQRPLSGGVGASAPTRHAHRPGEQTAARPHPPQGRGASAFAPGAQATSARGAAPRR
jgi:hypothetical protein